MIASDARHYLTVTRVVAVPSNGRAVEVAADRAHRVRLQVQVTQAGLFDVQLNPRPLPLQQTFEEGGWLISTARPFIEKGPAGRQAWFAIAPLVESEVAVIETIALPR